MWGTPNRLGGEIHVGAQKPLKLATPEHDVEGEMGGCFKVGVDRGEHVQVVGMVPQLAGGKASVDFHADGNTSAEAKVKGREQTEAVGPGEGGNSIPYARGAGHIGQGGKGIGELLG